MEAHIRWCCCERDASEMKTAVIIITIFLVLALVMSSPTDRHHKDAGPPADRRALPHSAPTKGGRPVYKGYLTPAPQLNLRKGEYICGNRVCKLKPGEIPKGCNGICQYPVA